MVVEGDQRYIYADVVQKLTCQVYPDDNQFNQAWHPTFVNQFGHYRIDKFTKGIAIPAYLSFIVFFWVYLPTESVVVMVVSIIHSIAMGKFFDYYMWYAISGVS